MKITQDMQTERKLINLYERSLQENNNDRVKNKIKTILIAFSIISIFTDMDHTTVMKKMYLSKRNILVLGIRKMAEVVYIRERTLYEYRKKYCKIINFVLAYYDDNV